MEKFRRSIGKRETFPVKHFKFKNGGSQSWAMKYFKPGSKNSCDLPHPNPGGSLSKTVNYSAIEEAKNKVTTVIADSLLHSSRSPMMGIQQS